MKVQTWYNKASGLSQDKKRRQEKRAETEEGTLTCAVRTGHGIDQAALGKHRIEKGKV